MAIDQVPLSEQAITLEPAQYGAPVRRAEEPLEVSAWIHTRRGHARVDAIALAWTQRAVWIRYVDDYGREGFAWVWASAVTRR
ncbi:hypothetical protein [Georgenia sp. H159]|uniref:hypothetical protein n=1 Tax=Georgenia sp. H159 TaxID=3076115 RepID=UPI002D767182|nr:hypothetical protein [Georgenia sp. H159]